MCRILFPERDRALQVLRQSDCVRRLGGSALNIQSKKGLLQTGAHNDNVPFCGVKSVHGAVLKKLGRPEELVGRSPVLGVYD